VGVADSLSISLGWSDVRAEDVYPIIEDAVKNALAIDNDLGEAYASLAMMHHEQGRIDEAETAYQKAIELSPNYASAYQWYSQLIGETDPLRFQERIDLIQKAAILDPRSAIIGVSLGRVYQSKGLYTLAERQYRKVIELHPDFTATYYSLSTLYLYDMGQFDKALSVRNKAIAFYPEDHGLKMFQVYIYGHLGNLEAIQEVRDKMADSGAEEWRLGFIDVLISFNNENPPGTREAINWRLQEIRNDPGPLPEWLGTLALAQGDIQFSREIYLSDKPGWLEPD
jgi:tetratricopeptide (TPR) repeat protein